MKFPAAAITWGRDHPRLVSAIVVVAAVGGYWLQQRLEPIWLANRSVDAWRTPFHDIRYVGSSACVECHAAQSLSYESTAMAHSMAPLESGSPKLQLSDRVVLPKGFPFQYHVQQEAGKWSQIESRVSPEGAANYRQVEALSFVIGSGAHARTFLVERPGTFLFEAPLTWYRSLDAWAMSPGYDHSGHRRFGREITFDCLFCHAGKVDYVAGSRNRYAPTRPIVEAAIGCERCHGPGEKHVAARNEDREGKQWDAIVNPANLAGDLANDVCLQCHRTGRKGREVLRPGRTWADFRPGMALEDIIQQFADENETTALSDAGIHFTGKMAQLSFSRCFKKSTDRLGCLTCHSIHHRPEASKRTQHYRNVCLNCHHDGCTQPEIERIKKQPDDSCYACHMPSVVPSDVPHTKITDHFIRKPGPIVGSPKQTGMLMQVDRNKISLRESKRNLGIAYGNRGAETGSKVDHERAIALLEESRSDFPKDVQHRQALALSYAMVGRHRSAIPALKEAIAVDSSLEVANNALASAALLANDFSLARKHLTKALEIDPYKVDMLLGLAGLDLSDGQFDQAESLLRRVLLVDAGNTEARLGLQRIQRLRGNVRNMNPENNPSQNRKNP